MINKMLLEAFDELKLPAFYISKGNFKKSCVVFNYIETPSSFADNKEDTTSYDILLNLYDKENIKEKSKNIIEKLNEYGFKKVAIQSALDCNDGFFNMPIKLKIKLESRD
ncbi:hypothetical protein [Clostridium botulinum]|uniref:hypothetical protein n=1 Tax=Clostridium botulinum TaxID=1491 RepID=UPI0006AC2D66|nr:hypothetical protein [Clostridium botulinum]KAI3350148.1 hypothetical protein CIT18_04525 [Clostridium botulinum]KOM88962.1 hypothetical protein ACP51_04310 [Clostridium botulinum]KOR63528.1 hypothetical protein ADT22_03095 [Clostridium botulinum]MCS6111544.1 hypothetical protein [Clostridium botulinum]NFE10964.1 hypothetical protein [Clostridium botulinum]